MEARKRCSMIKTTFTVIAYIVLHLPKHCNGRRGLFTECLRLKELTELNKKMDEITNKTEELLCNIVNET
jgi:dTDP-4-dehydrorhamnose 3,5-epimerase-like enzyme